MNRATPAARRRERIAVGALVAYALVLAFLLGPAIRSALGTDPQPVPDLGGPPAAPATAAPPAAGAPEALPGLDAPQADGSSAAAVAEVGALPQLSATDEARATAIMQADRSFRAVVGTAPYTIARVGPWTTSNGPWTALKTPQLLGASFVVEFGKAIMIVRKTMPGALYDVTETRRPRPYQEVELRVNAKRVTNMMVLVDLALAKVVNMSPGLGSGLVQMTPPAGFQREVPALSNEQPNPARLPAVPEGGE